MEGAGPLDGIIQWSGLIGEIREWAEERLNPNRRSCKDRQSRLNEAVRGEG